MRAIIYVVFFIIGIGIQYLNGQIAANFSSSNVEACGSLQTTFFDQSTSANSIISWAWDLGGNTSSKQNPGAIFTEPGQYTICLTVTDVMGNSDTECKEDFITVLPNPIADFTADVNEGCAPVTVIFSDLSSSENGHIVSWLWDLGGSTGVINTQDVDEVVSSSYSTGGNFTTSLTVEDNLGCTHTSTAPNFINVFQIPSPDIQADLISSCQLPWEIQFQNLTADPKVDYIWDFGNGDTFEGSEPPIVQYSEIGKYDVTIFMSSGDCRDTLLLSQFIDTDVKAQFTVDATPICANTPLQFTDISVIQAESVVWNFGDGSVSDEANPIHTYSDPGCFDVSLIRFAGECSDTALLSCLEVLPVPDVDFYIEEQFNCTLPTTLLLYGESSSQGTFMWEFVDGDQTITADTNFVPVTIDEYGFYTVNARFTDEVGCAYAETSIPVDITPFEANLPIIGPSGCAPLTFILEDSTLSHVDIARWEWSVGNPAIYTSNDRSPTFTIPDTGRYDVTLIVENDYGCVDTVFVEDYIRVGTIPEVNFIATPLESCVEIEKQFTDLSSPFVDEWEWQFGEFSTSDDQHPLVSFGIPGVFDIVLSAGHNGCWDSLRIEDYITILAPISRFSTKYNCEDPYTVDITNGSIGADSLYWTLRLSETDSLIFTDSVFGSYTFADRGIYSLSHYSFNFETGCEHTKTDTIRIVDPIASYTLDTLRGCAPLEIHLGDHSQDAIEYEYLTEAGTIDSIFNAEPTITFTEGGVLNGPLLIITDIHECKDSFQLMDSVIVNQLVAQVDYQDVICIPDELNLTDQSSDILGNPVSWQWVVGDSLYTAKAQDTIVFIDSVGLYDLYFKIVDDWGCEDSLLLSDAIQAVEVVPDFRADTLGCTTAPISFVAMGVTSFVDFFEWDFGDGQTSNQTNPTHTYAEEGVYSICLTLGDSRGCSKTICKEDVVHISDPVADFAGDPVFATCPPLLTVFENKSLKASSYTWDFGDDSGMSLNEAPSHVYTSPGAFDVRLIAQSTTTCFDTLLLEDYVRVEGPSGSFTFDLAPTCIPIRVDLFAESDGYYSYTWDYGNGVLDSVAGLIIADTTSFIYEETGVFTPKLIITDSIGCSRSFAGDPIVVNDVYLDFAKTEDPLCGPPLDVSLQNTSTSTTEDVSYEWHVSGPLIYSSSASSPVFNITESGLYHVDLVAAYDACRDTLRRENFLEIADIPNVSFDIVTDQFCENVNAQFINTSTVEYGEFVQWYWDFGDGQSSEDFQPSHQYTGEEDRTIELIGITDKGCESSFSSSFEVLPSMLGNAGEDGLICIGEEIRLKGSIDGFLEGGSFYWEENPSLSCLDCLDPVANPDLTSQFVFVSVHPNGCESRDTVEITVAPVPGPELTLANDSLICLGEETVIIVEDFNPSYSYYWDEDVEGQDCYQDCVEVVVAPEEATTYYVTVVNEYDCMEMDSVLIEVETSFEEFVPDYKGICAGESTMLEISTGNNPLWSPDPDIACLTCPSIVVSPAQSKTYYLSVESDIGCVYYDSINVFVIPENLIYAGPDHEICLGEEVHLNASGIGSAQWSPKEIIEDEGAIHTTARPDSSQYIILEMTYDECTISDSLFIEVHEKAEIFALGDTICVGESGSLVANGRVDKYIWILNGGETRTSQSIDVIAEQTQYLSVVGEYRSCNPDTATAVLYVHPDIEYTLPSDFYKIHLNDFIQIQPTIDESRNYAYFWSPGTGLDCTDCADPKISGLMEHVDYELLVKDLDSGCEETLEIQVRFVNECTENVFHLPNIFSPNGDGYNDEFRISTNNPEEFVSMSIFDRWGNLLFSTEDIEEAWKGNRGGSRVQPGVYVFKVALYCPITDENHVIMGDITVIY